jgi:hypothetical protein
MEASNWERPSLQKAALPLDFKDIVQKAAKRAQRVQFGFWFGNCRIYLR